MTTGWGSTHGAVTVLNATATGIGCSLAVEGGVQAMWEWLPHQAAEAGVAVATAAAGLAAGSDVIEGVPDHRLVEAVRARLDAPGSRRGVRVSVRSLFPPARGLKTSSSAAAALLCAARTAQGERPKNEELVAEAVQVSHEAGVTLTGALDDQAATVLGGCHLADNRAGTLLDSVPVQNWAVAIWVPVAAIPKASLANLDASVLRDELAGLPGLVREGAVPEAMTRNGRAFTRLYQQAGLPVDARPAEVALSAGALGAGLSGTGPAVAALFRRRTTLPEVAGGKWAWTRPVPGPLQEVRLP